jgi:hypothetical protein
MRGFLFVLISNVCYCQSLVLRVTGGARLTDDITSPATSESKRYIVGPMIELGLPLGFAVEADALYSREGNYFAFNGGSVQSTNAWEFPLLLKYRLPVPIVKPYAEAGWEPRVGRTCQVYYCPVSSGTTTDGFVIGGGVQFGIGSLRLSPEIRYVRWNKPAIIEVIADGPTFESSQNEVDLLVGFGWKVH